MSDQVQTRTDLEDNVWNVVAHCLKIDPEAPASQSRIRISWPVDSESGGQPDWKRSEDVCFIRIVDDSSDQYGTLLDISHRYNSEEDSQTEVVDYTRVHTVFLVFYGPRSYDDAESVRIALFRETARRMLRTNGLYPVSGVKRATRIPELFNGAWWDRADLKFTMYENVRREYEEEFIEQASFEIPFTP